MKNQSSRKLVSFELEALLILVGFAMLWVPATAQQDNRQLNRDKTQQANRASERRIALVIGNGAYTNASALKNPPNDARDMAATLKELGFEVTMGVNINQRDMKRLIREFGQKLTSGGSGLFYYAGHGVQSKGRNYLIPIEADIQSDIEVEDAGVDVNLVLGYMDDAKNGLNIVILDACRDNPFASSFRSAGKGLAQVDAPTGTLIAYATAPGRVASDGTGQNGLYTAELLKQMRVPGLRVTDMFMYVRAEVMKQTANKQVPWEASSLVGAFYFNMTMSSNNAITNNGPAEATSISEAAKEQALWDAVKDSNATQDFQDYLARYPNGAYAVAAQVKLRRLDPAKNSAASSSTNSNERSFNYDARNRAVQVFASLYATGIGQRAYSYSEKKQGYFSWVLAEGLRGGAANDKEEITLSQLVKYLQDMVPKRIALDLGSTKQQKPFAVIEGYRAEELVIAAPNANTQQPPLTGQAKRWALIIGVDTYTDPQISSLKYSSSDAKLLASTLTRYAGFPDEQVIVLATDQPPERQPTRVNILRRLSNLSATIPKDGFLLVSFVGHGMERAGTSFLLPSDAQISDDVRFLEETALSLTRLKDFFKSTGIGQIILILDASRNDPGGR